MTNSFTQFLLDQSWMIVIRALFYSQRSRSMRELIDLSCLSPAGTQDVLRRLHMSKIVSVTRLKNKTLYSLILSEKERGFLRELFEEADCQRLRQRAKFYSARSEHAIGWIDESVNIWQVGRKALHDTTKTS